MQKFSIYSGISTGYPFEERIATIKEVGFDAVCLDFEEEMVVTETAWENQVKIAQKYSLPVENAHLTWRDTNCLWEDGDYGDLIRDRVISELKRTKDLGIGTGVVHVTAGLQRPDTNIEKGLKRFSEIVESAEKNKIRVAFENSVFGDHVHYLFDHIRSEYMGFCFDSGHEHAFTPGEDYLSGTEFSGRLMAMHLHDNDGKSDLHQIPFCGNIDWEKKVGQLKRCEYFKNHITLECTIEEYSLRDGFAKALAAAKRLAET